MTESAGLKGSIEIPFYHREMDVNFVLTGPQMYRCIALSITQRNIGGDCLIPLFFLDQLPKNVDVEEIVAFYSELIEQPYERTLIAQITNSYNEHCRNIVI